jgi:hypothetical protein
MANRFANGRKSYGFCDLCGFRFDLKRLKNLVVKTKQTEIKACPQCWTPDQPQLQLGMYPIADPQAIRNPRPDTNTWYQSGVNALGNISEGMLVIQWGWNPVGGASYFTDPLTPNTLVGVGEVGAVTITDTGTPQFTLGEALYTTPGTYSWVAPAGVTSIYALCIGGGGSSGQDATGANFDGIAGGNSSFGALFFAGGGGAGQQITDPFATGGFGGVGGAGTPFSATVFGGNGGTGATGTSFSGGGGGGAGGYAGNGGAGGADGPTPLPGQAGSGGAGGGGYGWFYNEIGAGGAGGVGLLGIGSNGVGGYRPPNATTYFASGGGGSGGQDGVTVTGYPAYGADGGLYGAGGTSSLRNNSGGGGGGGLRWTPFIAVVPGNSYAIVVGGGGTIVNGGSGGSGAVKIAYWQPVP